MTRHKLPKGEVTTHVIRVNDFVYSQIKKYGRFGDTPNSVLKMVFKYLKRIRLAKADLVEREELGL